MKITSKKQKFIGTEEFINAETGEIVPMQVVSVEDRDFNFHKVWLQHLIESIDCISNQKLRLAFWIIDNLDKENKLVMTQRVIADKTGMSLDTVSKTMKALQKSEPPFLVKINSGAYMVNPNVIWKGSYKSRMGVIYDYSKSQAEQNASNKEVDKKEEVKQPQDEIEKNEDEIVGKCPNCGADVRKSEYFGQYCTNRCGMNLRKSYNKNLTEEQTQELLSGNVVKYEEDDKQITVYPEVESCTTDKDKEKHFKWKTEIQEQTQTEHTQTQNKEKNTKILGKCPNCGNNILWGRYGAYCEGNCGVNVSKVYGKKLSKEQIQELLNGNTITCTTNGWKNTVFPEIENNVYNGKTTPEWKRKGEKI